ncbi:MAG: acyltransferase [Dokdonella sp.]|uniref:acyltransferase family protein n=1 Tax=Dokdonella sp. TaxID=2291710 RepID=UPI0025BDD080|nr:acyltransferase [Dokdonella sp.]MBZ0223218.1 acyltransferase [Dokdonella sp.]MCC7256233.1 acyltransferase [Dokdonella sp.]
MASTDGTLPRSATAELTPLTGLRGLAALWVLVYHVWVESTPRLMPLGPLDFTPLFSGGWAGVDIFFTLSAFLLTLPYASRQLAGAPPPSLRNYWLRRVQRILPAYYGQLLVLIALAAVFAIGNVPSIGQLVGNLLLLNNLGPLGVTPINPVTYTLSIEFSFYLLLPLLALLLRPGRWPWLALGAIAITQVWRHWMLPLVIAEPVPLRVIALEQLPGRLDQFVAGMLAAYAWTRAVAKGRSANALTNDALLLAGIAAFAILLWGIHYASQTYWDGHWLLYVWHGLAGIATATILYASARGSTLARRLFDHAPLRWLGLVSFGVYLWHFPVLQWLGQSHALAAIDGYHLPWLLPLVLALSCAIAAISYRWIELPFLRRGRPSALHPQASTEMILAADTPDAHTDRNEH